jgi:hypothetical protein
LDVSSPFGAFAQWSDSDGDDVKYVWWFIHWEAFPVP